MTADERTGKRTGESTENDGTLTPEDRHSHIPVMLEECIEALELLPGKIIVDCTLGLGGHSEAIANGIAPGGILIGIDQDDEALESAKRRLAQCELEIPPILMQGNFRGLDALLQEAEVPGIDGALFDLGVSSPQLDIRERGFSYHEGPLDMRMNPITQSLTAAGVINTYTQQDLARVIRDYGEERWASRIAQFVVNRRAEAPITQAEELVDVIKAAIPASARKGSKHPARKTFQALRIEVNGELDALREGLDAAIRWLNPGGVIAVVSYHSLEDRIVKEVFRRASQGCICPPEAAICTCGVTPVLKVITKQGICPDEAEVERNPRARSAKLRVAKKLG